jgi:Flp pilus assembly protein TadG
MNLDILSRFRRVKAKTGQSMVEFAMVVPLFFLLIFGIIDLGHLFYVQMTLQNAMRQAGRYAVTGNHITNAGTTTPMSRIDSIRQIAQTAAVGLILDVGSISISSIGNNGSVTQGSAGRPSDTVVISLNTSLQLFTPLIGQFFGPNGVYNFTVSTSFRNEPFPSSQSM